ncbi:MAG TPA: amidohydrolase family protein, partial [Chitinophagales bacterium]|nr:amidohydrolase family protein [Chitinophagales bacterium]
MFLLRAALCLCLIACSSVAQPTFPVNGIPADFAGSYAFTNAALHVSHERFVQNATLVVKNGIVTAAGTNVSIPADAVVTDMKGQHVYPAFVDLYSNYGIKPADAPQNKPGPQFLSNKGSVWNWNEAVRPEENALERFRTDSVRANAMRAMGFGFALTHHMDGVVRGTGALVATGNGRESHNVVTQQAATFFAFEKGTSTQDYPSSLMGSIALLRQTFYDARWFENGGGALEQNLSLDALNRTASLPRVFQVGDVQNALRADRLADEFNLPFVIKGNGDEYQMVQDVKKTNATFIVPLTFPLPYDLKNMDDAAYVPLSVMKHWELAPFNARILHENDVPFCFTAFGFDNANDFLNNLRLAVNNGLPRAAALKALTVTPAATLGMQNQLGSLEPGKRAAFFVTNGDLFGDTTSITEVFIQNRSYTVTQKTAPSITPGHYQLTVNNMAPFDLVIDDDPRERKPFIQYNDTTRIPVTLRYDQPFVTFEFALPGQPAEQHYTLRGYQSDTVIGGESLQRGGTRARWSAIYTKPYTRSAAAKAAGDSIPPVPASLFPFQGYGWQQLPTAEDVVLKNATVWTNERDGIMQNADVWIRHGKIQRVGKNLSTGNALTIDATGKHLTSGIIDEHSHIAITHGVNEGTQSVTSEVRIGDALNARDVNIYRQLAGGVTVSHLLHGSANAIGGQCQLIKLRWGQGPEQLKFEGAPPFIKFALGENVKQSNWGDYNTTRFPQSRMGVEQVFYDAFTRAKQYDRRLDTDTKRKTKNKSKDNTKQAEPRRDLELDALAEILNEKRFIT